MDLWAILPELILASAGLVMVPLAGWVRSPGWRCAPSWVAGFALVAALAATVRMLGWQPTAVFCDTYAVDGIGTVAKLLIALAGLLTLLALSSYFRNHEALPHAPVALVFSTLGGMGLVAALDLILIVVFLQMMSLASYLLVGLVRADPRGQEAMLKYFLFAAVALAVMAFGLSYLYGLTGALELRELGRSLPRADPVWVVLAGGLVLMGYGFESTLVPFHFWAPDTYRGATAPVAGFLSVVPKVAGLVGLVRIALTAFPGGLASWPVALAVLAAVTMTAGNLAALWQTSLKRLLAYSSIAQAGYVIAAASVAGVTKGAVVAAGYYLGAYVFMNLGAFFAVAWVERATGRDELEVFRGIGRRAPAVAAIFALSLFSLAGFPPLAGFFGKVLLFREILEGGRSWLAGVAAANMALALFYYLRVVAAMYLEEERETVAIPPGRALRAALWVSAAGTLLLGALPGAVLPTFSRLGEILL